MGDSDSVGLRTCISNQLPTVVLMLLIYFEQQGHKAHERNSTYSSDLSGKERGKRQSVLQGSSLSGQET